MHHRDAMTIMIGQAALHFGETIAHFRAWHGNEGITEANLTFQLASVFVAHTPGSHALLEVPFAKEAGVRTNNRLDLYLSCPDVSYLVEAKCLSSPAQARSIAADISRMGPALLKALREQHTREFPTHCHGVVMAEAWNPAVVSWWNRATPETLNWSRAGFPDSWHFSSVEVFRESAKREGTLHWLFGVGPNFLANAAV